jgi:hypothetical protein
MIHYNVWFSFAAGVDTDLQLERVRSLLEQFRSRHMVTEFRILRNRGEDSKTKMPPYQVIIEFRDEVRFGLPFAEVAKMGIRNGQHGAMIEHVDEFVEVFEQI